ncbi:hypothetical protein [Paenibacillus sp. 481]|uniref:hypothetical protein n=1 Tax=Paenibacillus sp. 481 TaxID=2835869 RepID=UPI001E340DE2|nr:hypothetical protein [Paenibacillus sp. 481]UHA73604.1 hypothetical protein KIK04_24210 [Paenibacillus sp. 481]
MSLFLGGCEFVLDPKSLMAVPRLTDDETKMNNVILSHLPKDGTQISPRGASPIHTTEMNNDGNKEAIVFYETPNRDVYLHGMIFTSDGESWTKNAEFDGVGSELDVVQTADLNGDGANELIVGYGNFDNFNKGMHVYTYVQGMLTKMFDHPYSHFVVDDLDQDGEKELVIITNRPSQSPVLSVFKSSMHGKLAKTDELVTDNIVHEYSFMNTGFISKQKKGIILEGASGANLWRTDFITYDQGKLINAVQDPLLIKPFISYTGDVNKDGILEVSVPVRPSGWGIYKDYEVLWLYDFYQWDGQKSLKLVEKQYRDDNERFYIKIPRSWYGRVTIDPTKSEKDKDIYFIDKNTKKTLARIIFVDRNTWNRVKSDDWTILDTYGDTVIGLYSTEELEHNREKLPNRSGKDKQAK